MISFNFIKLFYYSDVPQVSISEIGYRIFVLEIKDRFLPWHV